LEGLISYRKRGENLLELKRRKRGGLFYPLVREGSEEDEEIN